MPQDIRHGFYFHTDVSGRPGGFRAAQLRGHVVFDWIDYSGCETVFNVGMQQDVAAAATAAGAQPVWGTVVDGTAEEGAGVDGAAEEGAVDNRFADYAGRGRHTCGEHINPTHAELSDRLYEDGTADANRALGLWHRYCLTAMGPGGPAELAYESEAACAEHQVFWESTFVGRVIRKGLFSGVGGISIRWEVVGAEVLTGTVVSDGDGNWEIHIRDTEMVLWEQ